MKINLLFLIAPIVVLTCGCFGSKNTAPAPSIPGGTFSGQFRLVHTSSKTGLQDTLSANIQLSMDLSTGYKVTGDTATVHAGSYGAYNVGASYITFQDKTFPKTGTPAKTHLNGSYLYSYDGVAFKMMANSLQDTISLQYDLKKVN